MDDGIFKHVNALSLVGKIVGIALLCIAAILFFYTALLFVQSVSQPLAEVLSPLPYACIAYALMKNQPKQIWLILLVVIPLCAIYCYYHGSVMGEVDFRMHDTPINYPAHWGHNYQLYRVVVYFSDVIGYTVLWTIIIALIYRFYSSFAK